MIYFDNAATTFIKEEIKESFDLALKIYNANSSSLHREGLKAKNMETKARKLIASYFNAREEDVIITSSATEANNLAIKGVCFKYMNRGKHIISSSIEHPSVIEALNQLRDVFDFDVTYIDPDENGVVRKEDVLQAIRKDTILICLMAVNNEIGSIQDIEGISSSIKKYPNIHFLCDATQAIGKIEINYDHCDLISFSGHKIHCLKQIGCLIKREKTQLLPLLSGGGHQYNNRSGTTSVANAVSLAKAMRLANENSKKNYQYVNNLRNHFISSLKEIEGIIINSNEDCSPYIISFTTSKKGSVVAESLSNKDIYVSTKSACSSKKDSGSYVLEACKKDKYIVQNSLRVSFSSDNTIEEINIFIKTLKEVISSIK